LSKTCAPALQSLIVGIILDVGTTYAAAFIRVENYRLSSRGWLRC